ncbi:hypothetical protein EDC96DRAFT_535561, partial [Choanephora cucurbitarum]
KGDKSDLEAVDLIPFCVFLSSVVFSIKFKLNHLLQEQDALMIVIQVSSLFFFSNGLSIYCFFFYTASWVDCLLF